jgi:hypothetical protein
MSCKRTPLMLDENAWLERLEDDGFVINTNRGPRVTRRWHTALARAALDLYREGQTLDDLRVPLARVLVEHYGDEPEPSITVALAALLPVVQAELAGHA